jgi:hypothetical protein
VTDNKRVDRGRQTQRVFADELRAQGVLHAEPVPASLPGTDVTGWPGVDVEVKATETASPATWLKQVKARAVQGVLGPRGSGPSNVDDWPVTLRWGDLKELLRAAGHLPPGAPSDPPFDAPVAVDIPASSSQPPVVPPPSAPRG